MWMCTELWMYLLIFNRNINHEKAQNKGRMIPTMVIFLKFTKTGCFPEQAEKWAFVSFLTLTLPGRIILFYPTVEPFHTAVLYLQFYYNSSFLFVLLLQFVCIALYLGCTVIFDFIFLWTLKLFDIVKILLMLYLVFSCSWVTQYCTILSSL